MTMLEELFVHNPQATISNEEIFLRIILKHTLSDKTLNNYILGTTGGVVYNIWTYSKTIRFVIHL